MSKGNTCVISSCKKNSISAKRAGEQLFFFKFPKNPALFEQWITICDCKDKIRTANKRVCSRHFKLEDFEDGIHSRLRNTTPKQLKQDAVPSLFLNSTEDNPETGSYLQSGRLSLLTSPDTICNLKRQFQYEKEILQMKIADLENQEYINKLRINEIDKKIEREYLEFENYVKFAFNQLPTPNEVQVSLNKKVKLRWTKNQFETKPFTVKLKYFSKPLYIYLKKKLHYPLPKLSTLESWIESMKEKKKIKKGKFSKFKKTFWYLKQHKKYKKIN